MVQKVSMVISSDIKCIYLISDSAKGANGHQ